MVNRDGSTVLRTSVSAALIGLGLVAAVMEVRADLSPRERHGAAQARQAYLNALVRAHRDGSVDGMRRTAEASAALGDHAVAEHCFRVANELAVARRRG